MEYMELIKLALSFLTNATTTNDDKEQRKNINAFKRHRRKIYRDFKKDGISSEEQALLDKLDLAYVEMLLKLGKF